MLFFMGRHKPIPGGLAAAVQAADTHEKQHVNSPYLLVGQDNFVGTLVVK